MLKGEMVFGFVVIFLCVIEWEEIGKKKKKALRASPLAAEFCIKQNVVPRLN
jgi:hypothetical protein